MLNNLIFNILVASLLLGMLISSCTETNMQPKPRMYPAISFPKYDYLNYTTLLCPYSFRYADYIQIETDSTYFHQKITNSCWLNLQIPAFNGTLHCSYYPLNSEKELEKYIKDAYKLAREHQKKANYIDELALKKPNSVYGMVFNIEGPAASPLQFYLTDSSKHFFRASLYFKSQTKPDSLLPVVEFVKKDVMEMINSFEWHK